MLRWCWSCFVVGRGVDIGVALVVVLMVSCFVFAHVLFIVAVVVVLLFCFGEFSRGT